VYDVREVQFTWKYPYGMVVSIMKNCWTNKVNPISPSLWKKFLNLLNSASELSQEPAKEVLKNSATGHTNSSQIAPLWLYHWSKQLRGGASRIFSRCDAWALHLCGDSEYDAMDLMWTGEWKRHLQYLLTLKSSFVVALLSKCGLKHGNTGVSSIWWIIYLLAYFGITIHQ